MKRTTPTSFAILLALFSLQVDAAGAQEFRFVTDNDLFSGSTQDDLYTFAVAFEGERAGTRLSLRENAFTDRQAGTRFDETIVSAGRDLPEWRSFRSTIEVGAVAVGRGLFGEKAQNAVHRIVGADHVELPYVERSFHGRLALATERLMAVGSRLEVGPRLEAETIPGLRSHLIVAAQARWEPLDQLLIHAVAGARASDVDYGPLAPHIAPLAPLARFELNYGEHAFLAWSYNEYGDEREHLHLGYRVRTSRFPAPRRD